MLKKAHLIFLIFLIGFSGCAFFAKGPSYFRLPRTPEMEKSFQEAEKLFVAKSYPEAYRSYQSYLDNFQYNYYTPKAHFRMAEIHLVREEWRQAIPHYQESIRKGLYPEWGPRALYQMAVCHYRLGEYSKSFEVLDRFPADADGAIRVRAGSLRVKGSQRAQQPVEQIKGYLELIDAYGSLPPSEWKVGELTWVIDQKESIQAVRQWTDSGKVESNSLSTLYRRFRGKLSGGYILWKSSRLHHQQGEYSKSAELADRYLIEYPKHEYVSQARQLLSELGKRSSGYKSRIGVLLPLSGPYAVYGQSVLHGLECAAGIYAPCRDGLDLILEVRDTAGDPQRAALLMRELASDGEVSAVIGPLTQVESQETITLAEELQIPMISLSQKADLPQSGTYIFRNFLTVADQVATLVQYACRERGWKEFAILYPQTPGGEEYLKQFRENVIDCGGQLIGAQPYSPDAESFLAPLRLLKQDRGNYEVGKKLPFEVLFFPDVYRKVPDLIHALSFLKLEGVHLLGGSGWDHPDLVTEETQGVKGIEGAVFVNGFYAGSQEFRTKDFVASFQSAFGIEPTLLEAYGYDTLRLVESVLRGRPTISRTDLKDELGRIKNFEGVTGTISFNEEGDARRRLFLLTVKEGMIQEIR